jgi:hypothetical protein
MRAPARAAAIKSSSSRPTDAVVGRNGDAFVSDGHEDASNDLALDSRGRLFGSAKDGSVAAFIPDPDFDPK